MSQTILQAAESAEIYLLLGEFHFGGNMFRQPFAEGAFNVAGSNIEAARLLLEASGFNIHAEHVGGSGHRSIIFDLCDGSVLVKHEKLPVTPD
jgi:chemotaxis protein CheD